MRWCERLQAEAISNELRAPLCLMLWWVDPLVRGGRHWGTAAVEATKDTAGRCVPLRSRHLLVIASSRP